MFECLILGDSIAVGTHQVGRPECAVYAKGGINSWQFNKMYPQPFDSKTVIISLGSNDHKGVKTKKELLDMRARVKAEKVYWILPAIKPEIQEIVEEIAHQNKDWIIMIPYLQKDGIHPSHRGYKKIGDITK